MNIKKLIFVVVSMLLLTGCVSPISPEPFVPNASDEDLAIDDKSAETDESPELEMSPEAEEPNASDALGEPDETIEPDAPVVHTYRQIGMAEAMEMMQQESNYVILDVRRVDEFVEGHIPNAINVPNEEIGTQDIPELPDKTQLILVYCRSGNRSKQASEKLVALGYTNIVEFGGIIDWPGEIVRGG